MITYTFLCERCNLEFDISKSIHDSWQPNCILCGSDSVSQQFRNAAYLIDKTPRTLGKQAELNSKKLGKYGLEDEVRKEKEKRMELKKWSGHIPEGASLVEKSSETEPVDMSLNNLTSEKKEKYIMTGDR